MIPQEHRVEATPPPDSTPKKLLFWDNRSTDTQRLEEELMTTRIREMDTLTEVKELRLKVMELETQVSRPSLNCSLGKFWVRAPRSPWRWQFEIATRKIEMALSRSIEFVLEHFRSK